jgi:hypothetical protein
MVRYVVAELIKLRYLQEMTGHKKDWPRLVRAIARAVRGGKAVRRG